MSSFTVTLTGKTSELSTSIYPEIVLDPGYEYACGLLDFTTYHSIPNITDANNVLHYTQHIVTKNKAGKSITTNYNCKLIIPVGSYELVELLEYIKKKLHENKVSFDFQIDKKTLKVSIKADVDFNFFENSQSIHRVLGFKNTNELKISNQFQTSDDIVRISNVNIIRIECNIVSGAYINGNACHSLFEFASNKVTIGHKIIEQPSNVVYMPVAAKRIDFIQLSIVDQDGELIDFRGEDITCRIHIKRGEKYNP